MVGLEMVGLDETLVAPSSLDAWVLYAASDWPVHCGGRLASSRVVPAIDTSRAYASDSVTNRVLRPPRYRRLGPGCRAGCSALSDHGQRHGHRFDVDPPGW